MSLQKSIALLLTAFPITENDPDHELLVQVYEYALGGVSDQNVAASVRAFVRGDVQNRNNAFRPSPAELAEHARTKQMRDDEHTKAVARDKARFQITHDAPPELSEAERRAHVETVLGRKVEHKKSVNPPAMTAEDRTKPKPWMKPDVLHASMARIEAQLEADGVPLHSKEADFIHVHNPEDRNTNK